MELLYLFIMFIERLKILFFYYFHDKKYHIFKQKIKDVDLKEVSVKYIPVAKKIDYLDPIDQF